MNPHLEKAKAAWGEVPDWLEVLADECGKASQKKVSMKLKVSSTVVNRIISNTYEGDVEKFAEKVRGTYMSARVECPVLGEIGRDRCIAEQGKKQTFENPLRPKIYRACRSGCIHSRLGGGK